MMSRRTATVFGLVAAASLLWMIGLVAGNVHAPTVETGRSNCGSAMSVVGRGSGYQGGEMRADEGSFDQICVDRARDRLRLAAIPGGILAGTVVFILVMNWRGRSDHRKGPPVTYRFDK